MIRTNKLKKTELLILKNNNSNYILL